MSLSGRPSARARRERHIEAAKPRARHELHPEAAWPPPWVTQLTERLRDEAGATVEAGCPTTLPDGLHWLRGSTSRPSTTAVTAEAEEVRRCVSALVLLQEVDLSTTVGADLAIVDALSTGFLVEVAEGRAVGFLLLSDENADGQYEVVGNVWTASGFRRTGVARRLLDRARADHPTIARLEKPITPMGRDWIRAVAPDLL